MKDKIISLIENAGDAFGNRIQRNVAIGDVTRAYNAYEEEQNLIKAIEAENKYSYINEILFQTENAVIFLNKVRGNDAWDKLYPYRVALKENDKWKVLSEVCDTLDSAMVLYLATKNNRHNMIVAVMELLNIEVAEL